MGRFEVVRVLGEGASGLVYHVRDTQRGNQTLALKVLSNVQAFDEHTKQRFRREIEVCLKINHPNVVRAYDVVFFEDTTGFTMEMVEGSDLGKLFSERKFSLGEIKRVFADVLSGLDALHASQIVHRDVKLENILITQDGQAKLTDFGLAKLLHGDQLTRTGVLLGTAHYLPPEYIKSSAYDRRSDLYALGLALLEVASGERWLSDVPAAGAIDYLMRHNFQIPSRSLQQVHPGLRPILLKATDTNPNRRYQSALEMRRAIESVEETLVIPEMPLPGSFGGARQLLRKRAYSAAERNLLLLLTSVLVLALIPVVLLFLSRPQAPNMLASVSPNSYQGHLEKQESLARSPLELLVGERAALLTSKKLRCEQALVSRDDGSFRCASQNYTLLIDSLTGDVIEGRIISAPAEVGVSWISRFRSWIQARVRPAPERSGEGIPFRIRQTS